VFHTYYRLLKSLVMPFSLTNSPVTFQNYINEVLALYLKHFCTTDLDDPLIYSDNIQEYQQYVCLVLDTFTMAGLCLKPEQCQFYHQEVKYLGLIITTEGIKIDLQKIHAAQDWEPPSNLNDIPTLLGFANFYRLFIGNYSHIVQSLTFLT
jgi:hypothetical protein